MTTYQARFKFFIPILILCVLLIILYYELFYGKADKLPHAINQTLPQFELTDLYNPQQTFSNKDLQGKVSLLNVWATWCYACALEAPFLAKISREYHVPIYGIEYKDDPEEAKVWLQQNGNPYVKNGIDTTGETIIDLGVSATPETFLIDKQGKILYRHVGAIDVNVWEQELWPRIQENR